MAINEVELDPELTGMIVKFGEINPEYNDRIKIKKVKFALSHRQREAILTLAKNTNFKHFLILKTQLETGLRIGELVHLPIDHVNIVEKYLKIEAYSNNRYIKQGWNPKTKAGNRIVPINKNLAEILAGFIGNRQNGYVFLSQKKECFTERSLINMINTYARKCEAIKGNIGSHALRRTYASFLMNQGVAIGRIAKVLGHKSIKITMNYLFDIVDIDSFNDIRELTQKMNEGEHNDRK